MCCHAFCCSNKLSYTVIADLLKLLELLCPALNSLPKTVYHLYTFFNGVQHLWVLLRIIQETWRLFLWEWMPKNMSNGGCTCRKISCSNNFKYVNTDLSYYTPALKPTHKKNPKLQMGYDSMTWKRYWFQSCKECFVYNDVCIMHEYNYMRKKPCNIHIVIIASYYFCRSLGVLTIKQAALRWWKY